MAAKKAEARNGSTPLVLVGARKPKLRKPTKRDWTEAKQRDFLTALAETCNVSRAADEAGVSVSSAYRRRRTNAAFRAGWLEAIAAAYQRLELVLLERSLNRIEKVVKRRDGSEEVVRDYSNQTALALLRMHRDTAVEVIEEPPAKEVAEIRARLVHKLERLRQRFEEERGKNA